jgi:hypothetical protein
MTAKLSVGGPPRRITAGMTALLDAIEIMIDRLLALEAKVAEIERARTDDGEPQPAARKSRKR